jgi:UDP-N-acetylglucosamine diphosphorylase/glucosamine-1-phosphate N-acetyltransferase
MNVILFDDRLTDNLLPLTFTRPAADIRVGILKISEKWSIRLKQTVSFQTRSYLQSKYKAVITDDNLFINGTLLPDNDTIQLIEKLNMNEVLAKGETILAARLQKVNFDELLTEDFKGLKITEFPLTARKINFPWDIFRLNGEEIENDFALITKGRKSAQPNKNVGVIASENIFIEDGARLEFVTLNASSGPIYIGKDTEIMEGTHIRGPFAILDHSQVKMGAKIYGPTTIGPHCKIGGELNNVVVFGFSNKSHEGFLGNSVIGEWCNIGADSNSSNLKNNYADVKVWNYPKGKFVGTGLQFCGLIMGDHSKCGINTMFNTGTVVGVNCNIFGDGFPRTFIPDFSWGGPHGFTVFETGKAFEIAEKVMERRGMELTETDREILNEIFNQTTRFRSF